MPPRTASRSLPFSEPNSSRNIIGKASAKKALNGLRRNSLFWYRTWRRSSGPVAGCSPTGGPREPEVDVLERRAGDGQRLQLRSACDGPAGEGVQVPGGGDAAQQDAVLVLPEPVPQLPRQVGEPGAGWEPEADLRLRHVAAPERLRAALGDDPAGRDDRHAVGQVLRLVHVVGGEQDRLAEVAQALHQLPRAAPGRGIEAGGRLVEEEQVGVADDAEGEVQAALLAAGQRPGPRRPLVAETDHVDHLGGVARVRVVAAEQRDDLLDAQLAVDAGGLEHDADPFAEGPLAALRIEVDPGDRLDLPIGLAQPLDPDGRHRVPSSRIVLVRGTAQG